MKITNKVLALVTILTATSQATTTITGTTGSAFKDNAGVNIVAGNLVMLVADVGGDGFLNLASGGAIVPSLTGVGGKTITQGQAGISTGSLFGGDTIFATSTSGSGGSIAGFAGFDPTAALTKNFAVVWFNQTPAALATSTAGAAFGIMRLSDWLMPSNADGAAYGLSTTDANGAGGFYSVSPSATATQIGGGFFAGTGLANDTTSTAIRSATFSVASAVPEPSAALLGAISALGLLRRRRN